MWRGASFSPTSTGEVDSATGRCAIQARGFSATFCLTSASSSSVARGPMTMPAPPAPSTGFSTRLRASASTQRRISGSSRR